LDYISLRIEAILTFTCIDKKGKGDYSLYFESY